MARNVFDREMLRLHRELADMAGHVDRIMDGTIQALRLQDTTMAKTLMVEDQDISDTEHRIEQMCLNLIALQQPLAKDLRHIVAALKIITDMERISDQCVDICEIMTTVSFTEMRSPARIIQMYEKAREMFASAIDAYIKVDTPLARQVIEDDDIVDDLFTRVVLEMCNVLAESSKSIIPQAADYMFIAKYIERIADHAANIAEWAIYLESGVHRKLNRDNHPAQK